MGASLRDLLVLAPSRAERALAGVCGCPTCLNCGNPAEAGDDCEACQGDQHGAPVVVGEWRACPRCHRSIRPGRIHVRIPTGCKAREADGRYAKTSGLHGNAR